MNLTGNARLGNNKVLHLSKLHLLDGPEQRSDKQFPCRTLGCVRMSLFGYGEEEMTNQLDLCMFFTQQPAEIHVFIRHSH